MEKMFKAISLIVILSLFVVGCGSSGSTKIDILYAPNIWFDNSPKDLEKEYGREADNITDSQTGGKCYAYNYSGALNKENARVQFAYDENDKMCYMDWDYQCADYDDYIATLDELKKKLDIVHGSAESESDEAYSWEDEGVGINLFGIDGGMIQVIHCTYYSPDYLKILAEK